MHETQDTKCERSASSIIAKAYANQRRTTNDEQRTMVENKAKCRPVAESSKQGCGFNCGQKNEGEK